MFKKLGCFICLGLCFFGCQFFKSTDDRKPVASVNETFLYQEDINDIVPDGASKADSTLLTTAYINRWALQLLLMDKALLNLSEDKQNEFLKLVEQYKNDLFTRAYMEALVKQNIDTIVGHKVAESFYESNKESFKLNDDLLQFRYISLPANAINLDTITKRFRRFKPNDKRYLDSISLQFKSYTLNDSLWIKYGRLSEKISVVNSDNKNQLLKKSNFIQLKDSLNLYLIYVNDVKTTTDYAPLNYVYKSIKKIVINKRKLELIKQLENDITKDAIKNNQFKIYN